MKPQSLPASSATSTTPPPTNLLYCSAVQWAAPGARGSRARIAGASFNVAEGMATGMKSLTTPASRNFQRRNAACNWLPVPRDEPSAPVEDAPTPDRQSRQRSDTRSAQPDFQRPEPSQPTRHQA